MKQQTRLFKPNPQAMARASASRLDPGDTDTWLTPRWILDTLGPFDLDPCAASEIPTWVAPRYFHTGG